VNVKYYQNGLQRRKQFSEAAVKTVNAKPRPRRVFEADMGALLRSIADQLSSPT